MVPEIDAPQDLPPLQLIDGSLCVASPVDFAEACFSVPAIRALKRFRPDHELVVLSPESLASFWKTVPECDGVIVYPDKASARKLVSIFDASEWKFEVAILWDLSEATKALARAGVTQRLGYPVRGLEKRLTDVVKLVVTPGPIEHRVRYYLNLVQEVGVDAFVKENFQTPPLPAPPKQCRIAVAEKSEYGSAYQWPREKFEAVKKLMEQKCGSLEWVSLSPILPRVESAENTVQNVADVLSGCSALLACDGEVAHWAAYLGLPAVVIFGPREPDWKRPLGKQSRVVREHVPCSPCYLAKCPMDHRCLNEVDVELVAEVLIAALGLKSGS